MCPYSHFSLIGLLVPALERPVYPFVICDVLATIRPVSDAALVLGLVVGGIFGWMLHKTLRRVRAWPLVRLERRRASRAEERRLAVGVLLRRLASLEARDAD